MTIRIALAVALFALLSSGCGSGELDATSPESDAQEPDAEVVSDMGERDPDDMQGQLEDLGEGPNDASETDAETTEPDMDVDPCTLMDCGQNAVCRDGECRCSAGFEEVASGDCVAPDPQDPATRTTQQLCDRWNADYPLQATQRWEVEPTSECDPGVVHPDALDDAIRRTTLFRWLVGLEPVTFWEGAREQTQHCATALKALGNITHNIPEGSMCRTDEAQAGAGSSNISSGAIGSAAVTVDRYIRDRGESNMRTLGHRRWIFNPRMGQTAFGWNGNMSCMAAFDQSNSSGSAEFIAWPPPGPVPAPAVQGNWSIGGTGLGLSSSTTVTVTDLSSNEVVSADDAYVAEDNYGFTPTVGWTPPADLAAGDRFEVVVDGLANDNPAITYVVELVDCSN